MQTSTPMVNRAKIDLGFLMVVGFDADVSTISDMRIEMWCEIEKKYYCTDHLSVIRLVHYIVRSWEKLILNFLNETKNVFDSVGNWQRQKCNQ